MNTESWNSANMNHAQLHSNQGIDSQIAVNFYSFSFRKKERAYDKEENKR